MIFKTFHDAVTYLGDKESRPYPVGSPRNTRIEKRHNDVGDYIVVKYHNTDVVKYTPDYIELNSSGWKTVTTKVRMNDSIWGVSSVKGIWYFRSIPYFDGIQIDYEGKVLNVLTEDTLKEQIETQDSIKKYAQEFIKALYEGKIGLPSGGDCWHCLMTSNDVPLGDVLNDHTHIREHIKESYFVPSLLVNALHNGASLAMRDTVFNLMRSNGTDSGQWGKYTAEKDLVRLLVRYLKVRS